MGPEKTEQKRHPVSLRTLALALLVASLSISLTRCGTAGGSSGSTPPPPPPPSTTVSVSPATGTLFLGQQLQFTATVTGATNTAVTWQVNGVSGGNSTYGTITSQGLYAAPSTLPSNPAITIRSVSQADTSASGSASLTLTSDVQVTVTPTTASVPVSTTQQFTAQITGSGTPATSVTWSLTGSACPAACGTLSASGNTATYSAPATVPSPATVSVVATSVADPSKSATAAITITGNSSCSSAISISPATASLAVGATQNFTATVCFSTNQNVTWSLTGSGCTATNCGTVTSTGANTASYTAPSALPPSNPVTLVATSAADTSQSASASIAITAACSPSVSISPSATAVALGQQQAFIATVCFSTNQGVTWAITGSGCNSTNCGAISSTGANTATYIAPSALPPANPLTLVATSLADSAQSGTAWITVVSGVSVAVQPLTTELATGRRVAFSAAVQGSSNTAVSWSVDGVANGNPTVGQICLAGSTPCAAPTGPQTGSVDFLAPATVPSPSGVYVTATAAADSAASSTAEVTVLTHLVVTLSPPNAAVAASGTVEYVAGVTGSSNTAVTWQAACAASSCGSITTSGLYTAPAAAPSSNVITVTATSQDDTSQSASATVAIASAVSLRTIAPASVTAGAASSFPLALAGYSFVPTSPGPGTSILIGGVARSTTCASTITCTTTIDPADVAAAGKLSIQAKNPDGTLSNPLSLVVVSPDVAADVISLGPSTPVAGAKDVVAVEPTTAGGGSSANPMTVIFLGLVDTSTSSCSVNESPITLTRPASGTTAYTICVAGQGLDPSDQIEIAGSQSTGITLSNIGSFSGSLIEITLTISSTTAPGPRALVFTDANNNRAVASGAIDVE
jgi:hypothetical protein